MPAVIGAGNPPHSWARRLLWRTAIAVVVCAPTSTIAATNVTSVSWDHRAPDLTEITVTCDRPVAEGSYRAFTVPDPPRIVIVIQGVVTDTTSETLNIADGTVGLVRIGAHPDRDPTEVHVVLDVSSDRVRLQRLTADGTRLIALVGRLEPASPSPTPVPTPTAGEPQSDGHPEAPVPTAATAPPPADRHPRPDEPVHDSLPPALDRIATPIGATPSHPATEIVDIRASERDDGSTLLLITADGRLPLGCARVLAVSGTPPRLIVSLRSVSAPKLPRMLDVGDANIERLRLVHGAETTSGELHVVLQLARPGVRVVEQRQVGENLVLQLAPSRLEHQGR